MFELSKQFRFDAAHKLERDVPLPQKEASRRIHGHSYRAEVTLRGGAMLKTGMVVDLGVLQDALDALHQKLDHQMLNDIAGLDIPTMENICVWIWDRLAGEFPNLMRVTVFRDSGGESCVYYGGMLNE